MVRLSSRVPVLILRRYRSPITPTPPKRHWFGLFRVRSPLLAESQLFSLPAGTKMFQFPAFASSLRMITGLQPAELPHSEIAGSKVVCTYPTLFAAYHVLLRLPEPRHPPFALFFLFLCEIVVDLTANPTIPTLTRVEIASGQQPDEYLHCELNFSICS